MSVTKVEIYFDGSPYESLSKNSYPYYLEYSNDGNTWNQIGTVTASTTKFDGTAVSASDQTKATDALTQGTYHTSQNNATQEWKDIYATWNDTNDLATSNTASTAESRILTNAPVLLYTTNITGWHASTVLYLDVAGTDLSNSKYLRLLGDYDDGIFFKFKII